MMKSADNMNILVVEDEDRISELIKIFLGPAFQFHSITVANSVLQAQQKCMNQSFDLIIVDHILPGKTGIEFIEQISSSVKFSRVKIILMSGYLHEEDVLLAIKLGVKHVIVKPFTRQQLVSHVSEVLKVKPKVI